jgi:hypothetical protein
MMDIFNSFDFKLYQKNKVQIHYKGNENITVKIDFKTIGNKTKSNSFLRQFFPGTWYVPNETIEGCEKIIFYGENNLYLFEWLIPKLKQVKRTKQKIVCLGLNKTGTTSFQIGLEKLGFSFYSVYSGILDLTSSYYHNDINPTLSALDNPKFDVYRDMPFSLPGIYKKLYKNRPKDIYVLTVRETKEKWIQSFKKYHKWLLNEKNYKDGIHEDVLSVDFITYNVNLKNIFTPLFDAYGLNSIELLDEKLSEVYDQHNQEIIDFFRNKPNSNFIVLDVAKPGELKRFTDWMNLENEILDFPWENKTN